MTLTTDPITELRKIKRFAATLLLIIHLDRPIGEIDVSRHLHINIETARAHLRGLSQAGYISRSGHFTGYILTQGGRQLVFPSAENPRMEATTTTTTTTSKPQHAERKVAEVEESSAENPRMRTLAALEKHGIGEPTASRLAALDWMTPEYIDDIAADMERQYKTGTGLLVTKLRSHDKPAPRPQPKNYAILRDGTCVTCRFNPCQCDKDNE